MTVKELILRLDGKLDAFIGAHETRHSADQQADAAARGDADGSPAGRELGRRISELGGDVDSLAAMVRSHDRTIQRVIGALTLVTVLGVGTLALLIARIAGLIPTL